MKDEKTNPSLVKWNDDWKSNLVFEIVEPKIVATMWKTKKGTKRDTENLTDSLSRGMRWDLNFDIFFFLIKALPSRDGINRKYFKKIDKKLIKKCHNIRQFGEKAYNQCNWLKKIMKESK